MAASAGSDGLSRALVLGGGGVVGIAWELGVLLGLADEGVDLGDAELTVGTSAGATVAAQITSGTPLPDLYARQLEPPEASGEMAVAIDAASLITMFTDAARHGSSPEERRAAIGAAALAAITVPEATRREVIAHRLGGQTWPGQRVNITAVDALTGDLVVFDGAGDVNLVDAVAASSAVPGVWPPVTINGHRYIDGGIRSGTNADLANGYETIVIISPVIGGPLGSLDPAAVSAIEAVLGRPSTVAITTDEASIAAMGTSPLDPRNRAQSAIAGRGQGRRMARTVAAIWRAPM